MTTPGLVVRHLTSRPLRTLLTLGAFAFSTGLLGLLLTMNEAMKKDFSPFVGQRAIVIGKGSFFDKLPLAYLGPIKETPGVYEVVPFDFITGWWRDNRPENQVPIGAAPAETLLRVYQEAALPGDEAKAFVSDPMGAMVGRKLAAKMGWKLGDRIVLKVPLPGLTLEPTVRALMRYDLDFGVYVHTKYYQGVAANDRETSMFWILCKTRDDVPKVTAALEKRFENAPYPILAMTEKQWQLMFMSMVGNVKALIGGIGLATAFALVLITGNTLAMGARERRGEAALLRILGFPRGRVAGLLLLEAALYGLVGGSGGAALMTFLGRVLGTLLDGTQMAGFGAL
ncbi:MAG TPA: ABC transporter permease, partial [Thermoanaerobaculia bacterium]|nr:ABC transporter permease [Thermoanaerobaculia bacterium]